METKVASLITVQATIQAPIDKVWKCWNDPEDIVKWNTGSDTWHTPGAENDLRVGGKFNVRMEAKDGSMGFDFSGVYDKIILNKVIEYTMDDKRKVTVNFIPIGNLTDIIETFEAETENSIDLQWEGWQTIMNNFKKHVENIN